MKNVCKVAAIQCPKCLDVVFSRTKHDYRGCSCREVSIDGGLDYTRISFKNMTVPTVFTLDVVNTSIEELYEDWVKSNYKFGLIKTTKIVYPTLYRYTVNTAGKFYRYEI